VEQFEFIKVTEIVNQLGNLINLQRMDRIHASIRRYLEGAQSKVGTRLDSNFKKVLKEAYDLLDGVRVEIESIQENILKLLKPVKKSHSGSKAAGKKNKSSSKKIVKQLVSRSARKTTRTSSARTR
jgi:hypothetical protein